MSFLGKFTKRLLGLNHVVFCNPDFAEVQTQTTWFKKTRWVGTAVSCKAFFSDISDQDGGRWKQQNQHTTFKSSYFLGIIIERVQKQHIMTS